MMGGLVVEIRGRKVGEMRVNGKRRFSEREEKLWERNKEK